MKTFAELISTYMKQKKITQQELASKLGVTQAAISSYKNGHRRKGISIEDFIKFSNALGVSPSDFIDAMVSENEMPTSAMEERLNGYISLYLDVIYDDEVGKARKFECLKMLRVLFHIQSGNNERITKLIESIFLRNER